ncbi:hypothetical protein H4582DRAFT_981633 [Lactarius indigo]|nr:hypothetical protein H4582DRAFT_981633 [Lactarius indigo]
MLAISCYYTIFIALLHRALTPPFRRDSQWPRASGIAEVDSPRCLVIRLRSHLSRDTGKIEAPFASSDLLCSSPRRQKRRLAKRGKELGAAERNEGWPSHPLSPQYRHVLFSKGLVLGSCVLYAEGLKLPPHSCTVTTRVSFFGAECQCQRYSSRIREFLVLVQCTCVLTRNTGN